MARITHGEEMHRDAASGGGPFVQDPINLWRWLFDVGFTTITDEDGLAFLQLASGVVYLGASGDNTLHLTVNDETEGGGNDAKAKIIGGNGLVIPLLDADPTGTASENGQLYYNYTDHELKAYIDGAWEVVYPQGGGTPAAHAASHEDGGADEIDVTGLTGAGSPADILDIPTAETDDTLVLAPDGAGGVEFRAEAGAAGSIPNLYIGTLNPAVAEDTIGMGAANRTILHRIVTNAGKAITTAYFSVTTANGNMCVQIFSADLATIHASTGLFAVPAAGKRSQAFLAGYTMTADTVYYIAVGSSSSTSRFAGEAGSANLVATGGWNVNGYSDTAFILTAAPTVTWESQQGIVAVYVF